MSSQELKLFKNPPVLSKELLNKTHNEGMQIYKHNKTFRDIANIMEHPEFINFFDHYFSNEHDANAMFKMLSTYKRLENIYNINLTPYQKIALLSEILTNSGMRKKMLAIE